MQNFIYTYIFELQIDRIVRVGDYFMYFIYSLFIYIYIFFLEVLV